MKKKIGVYTLILVSILVGVFYYIQYTSNAEKKELVQTIALPLGKEYIKQYYSADFILKDYEFNGPYVNSTVFLYGYIKGHEGQTVSITYDYKKKKIIDVSGPGWFIDSRNPERNTP
ncbi:hypothetical protein [Paenibacillus polymyxa]|uniref:hypothetical protein n=1 Tax=Paenibacillus polymyxa TaxID=1406 RepID=UPI0008BEEDCC|nr:hypothetical protein [Paenibacillus polymyxa]KAE8562120.1 hypothetical protein BJH92_00785 [Paenibacillus polymyxa]MCJ1220011.1 hypothetical protein [Paenibacillus polymyxa]QDA27218.1 hypothetical protein FGY93_09865 [Paenibacillus polymyxa]RTZ34584.1 hypothetical protein EJ573_14155 [Paenibacillus polymyxa]URJ36169.3 hypothetical protein MF625_000554 [Paenibacillus polymyxa]